jgi:hypothetical protein
MNELEANQQPAQQICDAGRLNGKQFRPGECVALLDGKVVAVAKDLGAALGALRALDPNPTRGMFFEVGPSPGLLPRMSFVECFDGHRHFSQP